MQAKPRKNKVRKEHESTAQHRLHNPEIVVALFGVIVVVVRLVRATRFRLSRPSFFCCWGLRAPDYTNPLPQKQFASNTMKSVREIYFAEGAAAGLLLVIEAGYASVSATNLSRISR